MLRDLDQLMNNDHINDLSYRTLINIALSNLIIRLDLTIQDALRLAKQYGNNGIISR